MISLNIEWLPTIIGAVLAMVLGFLWYSPFLFGKTWMKLSGITQKDMEDAKKKGMQVVYLVSTLASIIMAALYGVLLNSLEVVSLSGAVFLAILIWLGFIATTMITSVLYDKKPFKLFLINSGYQLASLVVIAIIFVLL